METSSHRAASCHFGPCRHHLYPPPPSPDQTPEQLLYERTKGLLNGTQGGFIRDPLKFPDPLKVVSPPEEMKAADNFDVTRDPSCASILNQEVNILREVHIVVVGETGVGKTSLIESFVLNNPGKILASNGWVGPLTGGGG